MPIYEYRRPDGTTFEMVQSFSDDPLERDPESGVPVQRVLHPPAVHFKGKGFYNTDYGTRKRQRETAGAGAAEGSSESAAAQDSSNAKESSAKDAGGDGKVKDKQAPAKDQAKSKGSKPVATGS